MDARLTVFWLCAVLLSMTGIGYTSGVRSPLMLVVVDTAEQVLGPVLSVDLAESLEKADALVAFEHAGTLAVVVVDLFNIRGQSPNLAFTEPDCQGDPFISLFSSVPLGGVGSPGITIYAPDVASTPQDIVSHSRENSPGNCQNSTEEMQSVVPAIPLVNLEGRFTPPFRVQSVLGRHHE